jgi:hypothetical protein
VSDRRLERDDDDRVRLLVSDRCQRTIREFLSYKQDQVGTAAAEDHCLDSTRYAIATNEQEGGGVASEGVTLFDTRLDTHTCDLIRPAVMKTRPCR